MINWICRHINITKIIQKHILMKNMSDIDDFPILIDMIFGQSHLINIL